MDKLRTRGGESDSKSNLAQSEMTFESVRLSSAGIATSPNYFRRVDERAWS